MLNLGSLSYLGGFELSRNPLAGFGELDPPIVTVGVLLELCYVVFSYPQLFSPFVYFAPEAPLFFF
jgi:hypothetical protein